MKILTIGDIHGRDYWMSQGDIGEIKDTRDYDKYVFLGDYCDSFDKTNAQIIHNLSQIVAFKQRYPDNVVLLLGNHDLQYRFSVDRHGCSGYRPEAFADLHALFIQHQHLFQAAYQIENYLFTHAGVTTVWLNQFGAEAKNLGAEINAQFHVYNPVLFNVGRTRGGYNKSGGPFWADKSETMAWPIPDYHQIVGHTPVDLIFTHTFPRGSITYCDSIYDSYEITM